MDEVGKAIIYFLAMMLKKIKKDLTFQIRFFIMFLSVR